MDDLHNINKGLYKELTVMEYFDRIDERLDRMEAKLDNHLERVAKSEEAISNMRGQIKWALSAVLAIFSAAIAALFNNFGVK